VREDIRRVFGADLNVDEVVDRVLRDVMEEGDAAVLRYNGDIDGIHGDLSSFLEVSRREFGAAYDQVEPTLVDALRVAADRIRGFHERQLSHSLTSFRDAGIGQVVRPIERVGLYVPGTTAVYPSTVLMMAVPAGVAGVSDLVMVTPAFEDGKVSPLKLIAADIGGVSRVYRAGGVQGIAALAYGTETVPRVDKICGPGNVFVTTAKRRLYGVVGIDGIFGPSETVVIADAAAEPSLVAADILAGAEHDELATAVLITDSESLVQPVSEEVASQSESLDRASVARASLEARGAIVITESVSEAIGLASRFAPEHLCLHLGNAEDVLPQVRNAGCVFLGATSAESIGDYTAGPSHVMPTGGSAAFASPLGVQDFLKATSVVGLDQGAADRVGPAAAAIAEAEGFTGHAGAIRRRLKKGSP
jgi:histidinol dehydrogenase